MSMTLSHMTLPLWGSLLDRSGVADRAAEAPDGPEIPFQPPRASDDAFGAVRSYRQARWATRRASRAVLSLSLGDRRKALRDLADVADWACLRTRFADGEVASRSKLRR